VRVIISRASATDADGLLLQGDAVDLGYASPNRLAPSIYEWAAPAGDAFLHRPGTYYWQAFTVVGPTGAGRLGVAGPVQAFDVALPASARARGRIPRAIGRARDGASFELNLRGVPAAIDPPRFARLVGITARRWGLRRHGTTSAVPGVRDGRSVVGFGTRLKSGALGEELEYVLRTYRQRRICFAGICSAAGPRTLVSSRVVERDVVIDSRVAWEEGPEYPSGDQYDLETVLIHELGHFAGNRRHATRCDQSSPMIDTIFNGEWWRTPGDAFVVCPTPRGTGQVSAAGLRPARRAGRLVTRQIVVGELVRAE